MLDIRLIENYQNRWFCDVRDGYGLLRGSYFGNKEFNSLDAAIIQAKCGLDQIAADKKSVSRLTNWPWISAILRAH
jgi:hypothetical protein